MLRTLSLPGLLLAGAFTLLAAPDSQLAAAECGGPGEKLCTENRSCVTILFFWQCTTKYDYWNTEEAGELEEVT